MANKNAAAKSAATSPVKALKDHLEALEKVRAIEKDARQRLQKESLSTEDQKLWSGILYKAIEAIETLEKQLPNKLGNVQ